VTVQTVSLSVVLRALRMESAEETASARLIWALVQGVAVARFLSCLAAAARFLLRARVSRREAGPTDRLTTEVEEGEEEEVEALMNPGMMKSSLKATQRGWRSASAAAARASMVLSTLELRTMLAGRESAGAA
jgi:hypothetical protein